MNNSKLILTFAVVALLHLGAGSVLLMQPGCKSTDGGSAAATVPPADAANAQAATTPPAPATPELLPPTRPATPVPVASLSSPQEPLTPAASQQLNPPFAGGAAPAGVIVEYEVKSGDNLTKIGQQFGVTPQQIAAANNMGVNAPLRVNQLLVIPASSAAAPATTPPPPAAAGGGLAVNGSTYTVKSGDVLGTIARQFGTSVPAIQAANNMTGTVIRPGQVLVIPAPGPAAPPRATAPTPAPAAAAATNEAAYVVKAGDSPDTIARAHGVRVAELMALNNISDPRRIQVGQRLRIPAGGTAPAGATPPAAPPAATATPPAQPVEVVVPIEVIEVAPPITTPVAPN